MEASEQRDNTQDWLIPEGAPPLSVGEMEARIDEALAAARGSEVRAEAAESAVVAVGESALDAARQARRAAGAAERAAASAADAQERVARVEERAQAPAAAPLSSDSAEDSLRRFDERADRVMRRLRDLGCAPGRPARAANGRPAP